jgi:hypothetical protein
MKHLRKNRLAIGGAISVLVLGLQVGSSRVAEALPVAKAIPEAKTLVISENALRLKALEKYHNADRLTKTDLVGLLSAVGFKGQDLREAWAIAMKESRGNPLSHNGNRKTGDNSYGLFQVNMIGSMGQERRDKFSLDYNAELLDPVVNAKIAYHMSNGGKNWSAWKGTQTKVVKFWLSQFPDKAKAKAIAKAKA